MNNLMKFKRDDETIPSILESKLKTEEFIAAWIDEDGVVNYYMASECAKNITFLQKILNEAIDEKFADLTELVS